MRSWRLNGRTVAAVTAWRGAAGDLPRWEIGCWPVEASASSHTPAILSILAGPRSVSSLGWNPLADGLGQHLPMLWLLLDSLLLLQLLLMLRQVGEEDVSIDG